MTLIRTLADGARHPFAALAEGTVGSQGSVDVARVADAIARLREYGMPLAIEGAAVRCSRFEALDTTAVAAALPGWGVEVVGSTASTNSDVVRALRSRHAPRLPTLLACELQHAGRGRRGRHWHAAPGVSLTASFALSVDRKLAGLDGVTLVCGLAVREAVLASAMPDRPIRLKWPNDLLVDGRKLAGILVEAHASGDTTAIVAGVGLNVGIGGSDLARPAWPVDRPGPLRPIDLAACGAAALDRNRLLVAIAAALERRVRTFAQHGFEAFVDAWNDADALRDRPVRLTARGGEADGGEGDGDGGGGASGFARGVDATGALLVDVDGGTRTRVVSGDVSVRPFLHAVATSR